MQAQKNDAFSDEHTKKTNYLLSDALMNCIIKR